MLAQAYLVLYWAVIWCMEITRVVLSDLEIPLQTVDNRDTPLIWSGLPGLGPSVAPHLNDPFLGTARFLDLATTIPAFNVRQMKLILANRIFLRESWYLLHDRYAFRAENASTA